jgi:hypothetical protein
VVRRRYMMLANMPSTRGRREAHPEHVGLDGEACGGLVRRNWWLRPSEKMSSTGTLQDAPARFLAWAEQEEGGDDDGGHGGARGCPNRRR